MLLHNPLLELEICTAITQISSSFHVHLAVAGASHGPPARGIDVAAVPPSKLGIRSQLHVTSSYPPFFKVWRLYFSTNTLAKLRAL
jgi:hypothetical protein